MSKNLRVLRASKGFSQIDMAQKLGICLTSYNQKEVGKKIFTLTEAKAIADIFDLKIEEIFFNDEVINLITKYAENPNQLT